MSHSLDGVRQRIAIRNGRLLNPATDLDQVTDLFIDQGEIVAIGEAPLGFIAEYEIDASDQLVLPGIVDLCARLGEPGKSQQATIASETQAAAAGGITHLCCPPDTHPIIDSRAVAVLVQGRAHAAGLAQVLPIGAMTQGLAGEALAEMHALQEAGCVAVSQLRYPIKDSQVLLRCLEYASTFDLAVFFHSVDPSLSAHGGMHAGPTATRLGLMGIPACAETIALSRDLQLVEHTGVKAHFSQISCARSVELIAEAQGRGLPVTADVAVHQLYLTDRGVDGFNGDFHVEPPVRTESDRQALLEGVRSGVISMICSAHHPHDDAAKQQPFAATEPGISALDSFLPLTWQLVLDGQLSEMDWVKRVTAAPAALLGIDAGNLDVGCQANVCVFNPHLRWQLTPDQMLSAGKNTPFLGRTLNGQVSLTIADGMITCAQGDPEA